MDMFVNTFGIYEGLLLFGMSVGLIAGIAIHIAIRVVRSGANGVKACFKFGGVGLLLFVIATIARLRIGWSLPLLGFSSGLISSGVLIWLLRLFSGGSQGKKEA